jgi:uncharacterized cupin superfamily protein
MQFGSNVWAVEWDENDPPGVRGQRLLERPPGSKLRAAVWELEPGATQGPYHLHHGAEEVLIVLRGRPTLRTPSGERELAEGEVVHFPNGAEGAHQVSNRSEAAVRYVIAAAHTTPDVVEYPDDGEICAWAATESPQQGAPLFVMHRLTSESDEERAAH